MFNKKGFTLIEFIIVMAIIGILVLMAAPKFMDYVDRAHQSRLMNDIKVVQNTTQALHADHLAGVSTGVKATAETDKYEAVEELKDIQMKDASSVKVIEVPEEAVKNVNLSTDTATFYIDEDLNVYAVDESVKAN